MKKVYSKKYVPLTVTYGIKSTTALPFVSQDGRSAVVHAGWISLHFGWDEKGRVAIYAITKKDSLFLSAFPPRHSVPPKSRKHNSWVYAIDGLPSDFYDSTRQPTRVSFGGCEVTFGKDESGRDFLTMRLSNSHLIWLFRNPTSSSTVAWNPRRAVAVDDAILIHSHWNAAMLEIRRNGECTGDDEIDELLCSVTA